MQQICATVSLSFCSSVEIIIKIDLYLANLQNLQRTLKVLPSQVILAEKSNHVPASPLDRPKSRKIIINRHASKQRVIKILAKALK